MGKGDYSSRQLTSWFKDGNSKETRVLLVKGYKTVLVERKECLHVQITEKIGRYVRSVIC